MGEARDGGGEQQQQLCEGVGLRRGRSRLIRGTAVVNHGGGGGGRGHGSWAAAAFLMVEELRRRERCRQC